MIERENLLIRILKRLGLIVEYEVSKENMCKHWWNEYGDSACMLHSDFTVNSDDFCSYGERKESE